MINKKFTDSCLELSIIFRQYLLEIILFAIITVFFIITKPESLILAFQTLFSQSILVKMVSTQQFIVGGTFGFVVLSILYISIGIRSKYKIKTIIFQLSSFFLMVMWFVLLIDTTYLIATIENIIKWSGVFLDADRQIFGGHPVFMMYSHYNIVFERLIVWTYNYLTIILTFWTGYLIASQKMEEFVVWARRIFLALAISIPLWIAFPAMEPLTVYMMNIFKQEIPADILAEKAKGPPSQFLNRYTLSYRDMWIDPTGVRHAVSTFPSMHTIWGFLLLFSVKNVFNSHRLNILFFLLACANMLGAIYTLQHYAVDIIAGILVALLVVYITRKVNC